MDEWMEKPLNKKKRIKEKLGIKMEFINNTEVVCYVVLVSNFLKFISKIKATWTI